MKKKYCGLSKQALERIREVRVTYKDLMSLNGIQLERVTHAAILSFVKDGAPVKRNPYDEHHQRVVVKIR